MKKLALIAALASVVALPMTANAATVSGGFNVTVAFTPSCTVVASVNAIAFTYTAFAAAQTVAVNNPIVLTCSRGIGALATAGYGEGGAASGLIGTSNLRYTLSAPARTSIAGTPATGVAAGVIGTADSVSFTFSGTLPQQAGGGVTINPSPVINATDARTLVVTF